MSLLLLAALALAQNLQVRAELVPQSARAGDPIVLRVTAEARGERPRIAAPALPNGLAVVGTSESSSTSISTSGRAYALVREYVLMGGQAGTYAIPPIKVEIDGEGRLTAQLVLRLSSSANAAITRDALLTARLQPDTVYVGQQATLVGEILVTPDLQMRLARPPTYEMPAPSEFWIQELEPEPQAEAQTRAGGRYNAQRFARAYFPLTAGKYQFAPIEVTYEARQGFVFAPQTMQLRSESPRLVVIPLPTEGRPETFRGAVGRFTLSSILDARDASVGDGVTLTLLVQGAGNIKALPAPILPKIEHVTVLEPAELAEIQPRGRTVQGSKRFSWVLVPERPGRIEIPPITFTYFDPATRKYVTEQTSPLAFDAAPASAAAPSARATSMLRGRPGRDPLAFVWTRGFLAIQIVPLLLVIAAWVATRRKSGPSRKIWRAWTYRLDHLGDRENFAAAADRLLRDALYAYAPQNAFRAGAVPDVERALRDRLPAELATDIIALTQRFSDIRYSNSAITAEERAALQQRLRQGLAGIWKEMRAAPRAAFVPILLALSLQQGMTPDQLFTDAVKAWEQRDFAAAVRGFERYTAARPHDANGWYNLGLARQAAQQPAAGALALLKAVRIEPRSPELGDQLRRAGVTQLARRVRPVTSLTPSGTLVVMSGLWWLACILIAAAIIGRRRLFGWLALVPLAAAGILITASAIERVLPPAGMVLDQAAHLYVGRSLHAETLRQLQPLAGVTVLEESEGWLKVRTLDGEVGWVRQELVAKL
jgi:hypothetical protein